MGFETCKEWGIAAGPGVRSDRLVNTGRSRHRGTTLFELTRAIDVKALRAEGYAHSQIELGADWDLFAESWSNLLPDTYMADGGRYRARRYSEFSLDAATGAVSLLPHVAYRQERDDNRLNGGVDRLYEPFEPAVVDSAALAQAFAAASAYLEGVRPGESWKAQCFQNRIISEPDEVGHPAPEGIHRDGVDFVLTLFVDRVGAEGGVSSAYLAEDQSLLAESQLAQPGEYLFVDDRKLLHGVTGLSLESGHETGYRDVLIAMFTALEK